MQSAPLPENEGERLKWLNELDILDTLEEQAYDDLTRIAAQLCAVPMALVSLVDRDRQWFKSHHGLDAHETPRDLAFCAHAILEDPVFIVEDADHDPRFNDNPLVTGGPLVKFYAGAPLILRDNIRVGTLCVIDHKPRTLNADQRAALEALARQVVSQLELRLQLREMHRVDDSKDEFVNMVSHELRTPLTAINGSLGLLYNDVNLGLTAHSRTLVEIAYRNTERLLHIVNDILDASRITSGHLELRLAAVDMVALAQRAVLLSQPYCEKCGCSVVMELSTDAGSLIVQGDEQRLLQVISNIISNAAKFSPRETQVTVAVRASGATVWLGVTDLGPGIPADKRGEIFQRFHRLHSGDDKMPGTGLGLHICKKIIDLHGGEIGFDSVPGDHTTFYFTLPRVNL
ncbi:MAG: GAF domain-containing sensor histidine kinase [Gammaproteobacteria bacterium]|nr:GAF domain-containing sensor histidine kinase [Gammaproteobacteria bacterium]